MNKLFFISNSYRKNRINGFIEANCFGSFKLMDYIEPLHFRYWILKKIYYNIKLLLSDFIIVSDLEGINYLQHFSGLKNKKINLIMWNSEKELDAINVNDLKLKYKNLTICFFFKDAVKKTNEYFGMRTNYLTSPVIPYAPKDSGIINRIIYCAEVDIFPGLAAENENLNKATWEYAERIVTEGSHLLYKTELISAFFHNFEYNFDMSWVLKNRVRFIYAKKLKEVFKEKFILVGNDWIQLGFDAMPSDYNMQSLYTLYACSKVNIDLLSKSSNEALFERVMQIISTSNGLLQLQTEDSYSAYGNYSEERTFNNFENAVNKINALFLLNTIEFKQRGENLRTFMKEKSSRFI